MPIGKKETPSHRPHSPESISVAKEQLLAIWEALPNEHKATIALLLVNNVMEGEYQFWLQQAIAFRWPLKTEHLELAYPHFEISEQDLHRAHLDEAEIARLAPEHLRQIGAIMRNHYIHDVFWPEMQHVAHVVLESFGRQPFD